MSEGGDWGDLESLPEQKRVVPRWLWACGCGCLLVLILLGSGVLWTVGWVQDGRDPERFWSGLAEVIAYDEQPSGFEPMFGNQVPFIDMSVYMLASEGRSSVAIFFAFPAEAGSEARDSMMTPEDGRNVEELTLDVQGRELRAVRFEGKVEAGNMPGSEVGADGQSMVVDLTEEDGRPLILLFSNGSESDPVPVEDVVEFLRPFHVGPDR